MSEAGDDPSDVSFVEIENVIKLQMDKLNYLKGIETNFNKTQDIRRTKSYFALKIKQLRDTYEEFFDAHKQIVCSNLDAKNPYFANSVALQFDEGYVMTYSDIQTAFEEKFPPAEPIAAREQTVPVTQRNYTGVQLPHIAMPKFSGKHIDWPPFHDSFTRLVHQNLELNSVQKFNFLKQAIPAQRDMDIHDMPLTNDNYAAAWDLLVKRYNNPRILYMHHLNTLYSLPMLSKERAEDIKMLLNAANVCITALRRLEIPINQCDHWIAHLIATKLPKDTHHEWEHHWGSNKAIPTFSDLEVFLNDRLFTLDAIEHRNVMQIGATAKSTNATDSHKSSNAIESKAMKRHHYSERKSFHTTTTRNTHNIEHCPLCSGAHIIRRCQSFIAKDCFERKAIADKFKLCLNCLSNQHFMAQCGSSKNCSQCGSRHHTLLHFPVSSSNGTSSAASSSNATTLNVAATGKPYTNQASIHSHHSEMQSHATNILSAATIHTPKNILLATAMIPVENIRTGKTVVLRALIDDCSEGTIISEHAANILGLARNKAITDIKGVGQNTANVSNEIVNFALRSNLHPRFKVLVDTAIIMKIVTSDLPSRSVIPQDWPHIHGLVLADPTYFQSRRIDLLIGTEMSASILLPDTRIGRPDHPIARNTYFGWILHGQTTPVHGQQPSPNSINQQRSVTVHSHHTAINLTSLFHEFIDTEQIPEERTQTEEEKWFLNFFEKTYQRQQNGKYMVRLPFKSHNLGRSHQIAINWFHRLERRFDKVEGLRERYTTGIEEYFKLNQIIPALFPEQHYITTDAHGNSIVNACVLPHHAIIKEDSLTTKTRIVYNAAAKTSNGRSLNDNLSIGPALQAELPAVILNWRSYEFVFTADIQRMYRCIDMHPDDIPYQQILWRNDVGELQTYCLTTVTFGTSPAPCLAIRVMHQIADDEKENYPLAEPILKSEMYVDDVQSGSHSLENALNKRDDLIAALQSAGMELRKWCSNHPSLLSSIPIEHQAINSPLEFNMNETVKTLGMVWQPNSDHFTYKLRFELPKIATKRSVLSTTARLYDPLGFIAPVIVVGKIILKNIWCHQSTQTNSKTSDTPENSTTTNHLKLNWDDVIPESLYERWNQFLIDLPDIEKISIPRWINFAPSQLYSAQLHTFCDGSSSAYAAQVFIRQQYTNGDIFIHMLIAKSKVTPSKPITIARVELCGAELAARLVKWVHSNLRLPIEQIPVYLWSDAMIVLHWIHGDVNRWKTFVGNRVSKILSSTVPAQWSHVRTHDNPADCATRGLSPTQLSHFDLWWKGPQWLAESDEHWPKFKSSSTKFDDETAEVKSTKIHIHVSIHCDSIIYLYSSLSKLIRITSWIRRYHHNSLNKMHRIYGPLTIAETQDSLFQLVRLVQAESFGKELNCILSNEPLPKKSRISGLAPFLDEHKILRVRGRLQRSNLPYQRKHPMILPRSHQFTNLVIDNAHLFTLHGGTQLTLTYIRNCYWIVNGRQTVGTRIRKCVTCFKVKPEVTSQLMGNLPNNRVNQPDRPFLATGVDFTGAIELKSSKFRGNTTYKGYIIIFICLATKAVHLEAATGLSTEQFLCALDRFIGRRGKPRYMHSDNGTNFIGAEKIVGHNSFVDAINKDVIPKLTSQGIQWCFNPPHSPNFGGLWEANIKSTKFHLKRVIDSTRLTFEELTTVLVRIESCLNSRPLCPLTSDPDDLDVLTPGHFLIGDALLAPPINPSKERSLSTHYLTLQHMIQHFWTKWSSDWLSHLQSRPKWCTKQPNLQINDLVLIKDDRLPPNEWRLGRIIELHPGADQLVRVVTVRTKDGPYKRSLSKLCRLPIDNHTEVADQQQQ